jgi:SAM-dependent methyltransferase
MQTAGPELRTGSASIEQPEYWWYRARADLLQAALAEFLADPELVLDVGSADGPSVAWMRGDHRRVTVDVDPRGLQPGEGVCASALSLPFDDSVFDVVGAFDVIEHCDPEATVLEELARVLRPGGRLLASVPAYSWAWTDHDVRAGHHRRYTEGRIVAGLEAAGFRVRRSTYGFAAVFPMFVAERAVRRLRRSRPADGGGLPQPPAALERVLLDLSRVEARLLRKRDLPFGSSVFVCAEVPAATT